MHLQNIHFINSVAKNTACLQIANNSREQGVKWLIKYPGHIDGHMITQMVTWLVI